MIQAKGKFASQPTRARRRFGNVYDSGASRLLHPTGPRRARHRRNHPALPGAAQDAHRAELARGTRAARRALRQLPRIPPHGGRLGSDLVSQQLFGGRGAARFFYNSFLRNNTRNSILRKELNHRTYLFF